MGKPFKGYNQSDIFLEYEADNWFIRNRQSLSLRDDSISSNYVMEVLGSFRDSIDNILEIGCSDARKVEFLSRHLAAAAYGIDPSGLAIASAQERFSNSGLCGTFSVGTSSKLDFNDEFFDLIFVGFCLYLVPREELEISFQEINRVLKPGGFLVIEDFDVEVPVRRKYSHANGVTTYKDNYAAHFTRDFGFSLLAKKSYSHYGDVFHRDSDERIHTSILFKELDSNVF